MNDSGIRRTAAALACFVAVAVTAFGTEQATLAGMWITMGCVFFTFALSGDRRPNPSRRGEEVA